MAAGYYNVTFYVWDVAGNVGSSEKVTFTVVKPELAEPFPIVPVVAVSVLAVALAVAGFLVYFRKRRW